MPAWDRVPVVPLQAVLFVGSTIHVIVFSAWVDKALWFLLM